jgi:hypothetical protein
LWIGKLTHSIIDCAIRNNQSNKRRKEGKMGKWMRILLECLIVRALSLDLTPVPFGPSDVVSDVVIARILIPIDIDQQTNEGDVQWRPIAVRSRKWRDHKPMGPER